MLNSHRLALLLILLLLPLLWLLWRGGTEDEPALVLPDLAWYRLHSVTDHRAADHRTPDHRTTEEFEVYRSGGAPGDAWVLRGAEIFAVDQRWPAALKRQLEKLKPVVAEADPRPSASAIAGANRIIVGRGAEPIYEFHLRGEHSYTGQTWVWEERQARYYLAAPELALLFKKTPTDLVKSAAGPVAFWRFAPEEVARVELLGPAEQKLLLSATAAGWTVNSEPGDEVFILQLLRNLTEVEALGRARPEGSAAQGERLQRIRVVLKGSAVVPIWEVYDLVESHPGRGEFYLISGEASPVAYIIDRWTWRRISPRLEVLLKDAAIPMD